MNSAVIKVKKVHGAVLRIVGETNRLAKTISNFIIHLPISVFGEYLPAGFFRKMTAAVVCKVKDLTHLVDSIPT